MDRIATRTLVLILASALIYGLSPAESAAQSYDVIVDDDGLARIDGDPVCDAAETPAPERIDDAVDGASAGDVIYVCPGNYGIGSNGGGPSESPPESVDEDIEITKSITIEGAGPDEVNIGSFAGTEGPSTAILIEEVQGGGQVETAEIRNLTLNHEGSGTNVRTIDIQPGVEGTVIENVTINRSSLGPSSPAIRFGDKDVTVRNCDISGGPIGAGGSSSGTYTVENNTLRGAGDEELWLTQAGSLTLRGNTFETTGDEARDQLAVAIYNVQNRFVFENNTIVGTRAPLLLGKGLTVEVDGQVFDPLDTVAEMRAILASNTVRGDVAGKIAFVGNGDDTLKSESNNAGGKVNVYVLRTSFTQSSTQGGSIAYDRTTLSVARTSDVIYLGDATGAQTSPIFPVDLTVSDDLGLATSGENSIRSLTMNDGATVPVTGAVAVTAGATLASNTSIPGDPLVLAPGATVTDNGLVDGSLRATRTVEADDQTEAFGGIGLSLTATGTAPGEVTVTRTDGDPVTDGDGSINRVYEVDAATSTGLTVDVGLEYDDGSNGGDNELSTASASDAGDLGIFRSTDDGTTWSEIASTSQNLAENRLTGQQLSQFGRFTLAQAGGVLPVEFAGVTARADGRDAVLSWTTASETNNAGFRVQQKTERGFEAVAFVEGQGTTSGETTYRHRVADLSFGEHVFRLAQVDTDGTTSFSGEVPVDIQMEEAYDVSQVAPMPISGQGRIDVAVNESQTVTVEVFDMLGRQMMTLHDGEMRGQQTRTLSIPADQLSSGHYFVRVRGEGFQVTRRMVIVQ